MTIQHKFFLTLLLLVNGVYDASCLEKPAEDTVRELPSFRKIISKNEEERRTHLLQETRIKISAGHDPDVEELVHALNRKLFLQGKRFSLALHVSKKSVPWWNAARAEKLSSFHDLIAEDRFNGTIVKYVTGWDVIKIIRSLGPTTPMFYDRRVVLSPEVQLVPR